MATVLRVRRISNPRRKARRSAPRNNNARRKRKMSPKQIRIFGTPAQKAALRRKNTRRRNTEGFRAGGRFHPIRAGDDYDPEDVGERYAYAPRRKAKRKKAKARKRNPALVVTLGAANPRRRKNVARRRRRVARRNTRRHRTTVRRRRRAVALNPRRRRRSARRANPRRRRRTRRNTRVVVLASPRRRRRNGRRRYARRTNRRRHYGRRRNPSLMGGSLTSKRTMTLIGGGIAGVVAAKFIPTMLPPSMVGMLGGSQIGRVLITGGSALLAGWAASKFVGAEFGDGVLFGGLMQTASVALNTFLPSIYQQLGIGLGDLMPGQFSVPQNPIRAGIPAPPANARVTMNGLARAYGAAF